MMTQVSDYCPFVSLFQHNTEWNPEPCVLCLCDDGEVTCVKVPCTKARCKPGEIIQNVPGQCCPQCIPAGSKSNIAHMSKCFRVDQLDIHTT